MSLSDDTLLSRVHQTLQVASSPAAPHAADVLRPSQLAAYIDHTLLKPEATETQIRKLCHEAAEYHFAAVCVNPTWVSLCSELLGGTGVKVATVAGFALGATLSEVKAFEAQRGIAEGASEIDMVINVGRLKSGQYDFVRDDIAAVVDSSHPAALVKVIIEAGLLTDEEKVAACLLAKDAGADFVKTSTGFFAGGATVADVALMRRAVGPDMGVKAAGGVRTVDQARAMIAAGATRIGTSGGVQIVGA